MTSIHQVNQTPKWRCTLCRKWVIEEMGKTCKRCRKPITSITFKGVTVKFPTNECDHEFADTTQCVKCGWRAEKV